ncbi:MAG: response regulator, partial [Pseudomonadota bacterium]
FIDSAEGEGAVFRILFPRLADGVAVATAPEEETGHRDLTGAGKILLVEDEAPVRTFARRALALRGYDVVEAEDAEAALAILEDAAAAGETIDLVVSDVMMPGLDGPSWVREARKTWPDLSVIFTSGYAEDVFRKGLNDLGNCGFLPKPFTLEDLGAAVKAKLTERPLESVD